MQVRACVPAACSVVREAQAQTLYLAGAQPGHLNRHLLRWPGLLWLLLGKRHRQLLLLYCGHPAQSCHCVSKAHQLVAILLYLLSWCCSMHEHASLSRKLTCAAQ